ncbi:MAG: prepilin-type N-terminal cleavage/methylation domain-containing protein [Clostridiales Family XIII bacterium]|jgi:prepilin-type N-terminal cleavage/methylation domain-containing protein|nr:prepilin-type N-terminal cleavage/methylation domain-containing protein [Clostridiales Family XIII bacterium]
MNIILKQRLAKREHCDGVFLFSFPGKAATHHRKGFTLVEVIVVLVILAILAAIAIPALTGYIDKAKWKGLVLQAKTQMTAIQTMLTEQKVRDGALKAYAEGNAGADDYFYKVATSTSAIGTSYQFEMFTTLGLQEYKKLTGDNESLSAFNASPAKYPAAVTDINGAIATYRYVQNDPPGGTGATIALYIRDVNSNDHATKWYLSLYANPSGPSAALVGKLKSGWNVFHIDWSNSSSFKYEIYDW